VLRLGSVAPSVVKRTNNDGRLGQLAGISLLLVALLMVALPSDAARRHRAKPLFPGDFDRGNLKQWHVQRAARARIRVVRRPRAEGRYAARFTVRPADVAAPGLGSGHRAEVYARGAEEGYPDEEGDVRFYGWCTYLPRRYPLVNSWQVLTQWKNGGSGSAPVYLRLQEDRIFLMGEYTNHKAAGALWERTIERGRWHSFVLRVRFGTSPDTGSLKLWYDGKRALRRTRRATMSVYRSGRGRPNYWKLGLYRSGDIAVRQRVYHDGAFVGRSYRAVARCGPR
jgi:hypothetical protein